MNSANIAFIGCGNMGRCLLGGLLKDGYPATHLRAADADALQRDRLSAETGVRTSADNLEAVRDADIVVLAVKPQQMRAAARPLAAALAARRPLVVSVAAGIRIADLRRWIGELPIVRAMPNTPALLGCGAAGLYAGEEVSDEQREQAEGILRAAGLTVWVESEALIDTVTAVSGSGPAYFFALMEWMENAGAQLGLSREHARLLTLQTALGASRMAIESSLDPASLRKQVTSPGGTTERALGIMNEHDMGGIVERALAGARQRAAEMAAEFGGDK
ncbi:MAG: Pyrroline-5-carboxylate reductase [Gammaproteobacteria bacterium]|nr:Pyrroline-5-carboxylate reductase [Gammaproteobacteria bacterium]